MTAERTWVAPIDGTPRNELTIRRARVPGTDGLRELHIEAGRVRRDAPQSNTDREAEPGLDAGGNLLLPGFVDAHVHLDKAYLLTEAEREHGIPEATLAGAIGAVERLGRRPLAEVHARATRAVRTMVAYGTVAARTHVEISASTNPGIVEVHLELQREHHQACQLQLCAFPQLGLADPEIRARMRAALDDGVEVVGGCPYVDAAPAAHLDFVFSLAELYGRPVDLHLDFSDDPAQSQIDLVVERTRTHALQGRVLLGHVTTLATMDEYSRRKRLDALAEAGIGIAAAPATDLYLGGQGEPGFRSLAPVFEAISAGVAVAVVSNNIANPFAPFGNASLLQAAALAGVTHRASGPAQRRYLLEAISTVPASLMGLPPHGPAVGQVADLALVAAEEPDVAVTQTVPVLTTVRAGSVVAR
ncbi:N-acyl-D-amino-acid deacylase [Phytohabitans rumicis]|uniref:N-acyl-D-amino-acid deacylase n=2 Tax=Phytohabitans rumicis TaxID=1076125 RepID=A0A6V8LS60_9ACTN|nr:N-acyl-D-amino-acid deacylase [Phytohabitans rumicis]